MKTHIRLRTTRVAPNPYFAELHRSIFRFKWFLSSVTSSGQAQGRDKIPMRTPDSNKLFLIMSSVHSDPYSICSCTDACDLTICSAAFEDNPPYGPPGLDPLDGWRVVRPARRRFERLEWRPWQSKRANGRGDPFFLKTRLVNLLDRSQQKGRHSQLEDPGIA